MRNGGLHYSRVPIYNCSTLAILWLLPTVIHHSAGILKTRRLVVLVLSSTVRVVGIVGILLYVVLKYLPQLQRRFRTEVVAIVSLVVPHARPDCPRRNVLGNLLPVPPVYMKRTVKRLAFEIRPR